MLERRSVFVSKQVFGIFAGPLVWLRNQEILDLPDCALSLVFKELLVWHEGLEVAENFLVKSFVPLIIRVEAEAKRRVHPASTEV